MEKSFSFQRIGILIQLDFFQKWKSYAWMGSLLIGCTLLLLLPPLFFNEYNHLSQLVQYGAIPILFFGSTCYTSIALSDYVDGTKGIFALMTPASTAEKIICSLVVNFAFLIAFLVFFWQMHYRIIDIANVKIPTGATFYTAVSEDVMIYISYCYFLFHSVVFAGSIYFSKLSYVKTLSFSIAGAILLSVLNTAFAKFLAGYPLMLGAIPFAGWSVVRDNSLKVYRVSAGDLIFPLQYLLPILLISGLYLVANLRLKEKQI
ncbi:hypothetical protein [Dyadobacter luticola]|uniref:Uncharacterized protein n=1 Tax=Dyadobacter luticola TaxID=1979387 RepID=A0A5R9KZ22_9BACT|nr:hypothetical protein [Dyadobacter luticola]TLV01431.1 hypothetical protein FEN17_18555 [Dyadobacter luticola]